MTDAIDVNALWQRVIRSVAMVASRTVVVQLFAAAGSVVLARKLSVHDVGTLAIGLSITSFASVVADGGLAAGLIRAPSEPSREDLSTALGLQLAAMTTLAVVTAAASLPFGAVGAVTSMMTIALPLTALQTVPKVILERNLDYGRVAMSEVSESATFFGWIVVTLLLGWGVWAVATAVIVREVTASLFLLATVPEARLRPEASLGRFRTMAGFGVRYQAVNVASLARDQGLNAAVGTILGVPALGVWALAARALQIPLVLLGVLWRVSYPTMAKVVAAEIDPKRLLERALATASFLTGGILSLGIAAAPATIPLVFGSRWAGVSDVLVPALYALVVGGPVSVALGGYLYATDGARAVLRSTALHTVAWFAVGVPLMLVVGLPAVGIGLLAGSAVDATVLGRAARRQCGVRIVANTWVAAVSALASSAAGWSIASTLDPSLGTIAEAVAATGVAYLLITSVLGGSRFWLALTGARAARGGPIGALRLAFKRESPT